MTLLSAFFEEPVTRAVVGIVSLAMLIALGDANRFLLRPIYRLLPKSAARRPLNPYPYAVVEHVVVGLLALVLVLASGATLGSIGLAAGHPATRIDPLAVMTFIAVFGLVTATIGAFRLRGSNASAINGQEFLGMPVPTTVRTIGWFVAFSAAAAVGEEIAYRGFIIHFLRDLAPNVDPINYILFSAFIFGAAHASKGNVVIALNVVLGFGWAAVFFETNSLLPGMVLHFLWNVRVALTCAIARDVLHRRLSPPPAAAG